MYTVKQMPEFTGWLGMRLDKTRRGLLGGGDKSSQQRDIASAIALSKTLLKEPEDDPQN
jgi:hypothetical protein